MLLQKFFTYSSYVIRHKYFVFVECCKLGIPLQGITHDLSKLLPSEFIPYMHFFGGKKKTRNKTGYYKPPITGDKAFDFAWLLHQKRNKHHWQWWILPGDNSNQKVLDMPVKYVKEMLADWRGAGRAQGKPNTLEWYTANHHRMTLAPKTKKRVEEELKYAATDAPENVEVEIHGTSHKVPVYNA